MRRGMGRARIAGIAALVAACGGGVRPAPSFDAGRSDVGAATDAPPHDAAPPLATGCPIALDARGECVASIAVGFDHACALAPNGGVLCWGAGGDAHACDVPARECSPLPVVVPFGGATAIAAGTLFTCAIADGVWCWGSSGGVCATGVTAVDPAIPTLVPGTLGATELATCPTDGLDTGACARVGTAPPAGDRERRVSRRATART